MVTLMSAWSAEAIHRPETPRSTSSCTIFTANPDETLTNTNQGCEEELTVMIDGQSDRWMVWPSSVNITTARNVRLICVAATPPITQTSLIFEGLHRSLYIEGCVFVNSTVAAKNTATLSLRDVTFEGRAGVVATGLLDLLVEKSIFTVFDHIGIRAKAVKSVTVRNSNLSCVFIKPPGECLASRKFTSLLVKGCLVAHCVLSEPFPENSKGAVAAVDGTSALLEDITFAECQMTNPGLSSPPRLGAEPQGIREDDHFGLNEPTAAKSKTRGLGTYVDLFVPSEESRRDSTCVASTGGGCLLG